MKKIFLIMTICILVFTGCSDRKTTISVQEQNENNISMFILVESADYAYDVVYHRDTKVMYAVSRGTYNRGTFTLLVNPDGSPMLYKEEK